jgi:hypothetical protein
MDNRFELIEKYKKKLIDSTNIETSEDEMKVLDSIMFRFWQMGWLDILERHYNLADDIRHTWCSDCMNEQHLTDNSEPCHSCTIVNGNFKEKAK